MDYHQLKVEIIEIGKIAAAVPEPFREKCFEVLLTHLLSGQADPSPNKPGNDASGEGADVGARNGGANNNQGGDRISVPSQVKAFLRKKGISSEELGQLVMIEDGEFFFLKEPSHDQASRGQLEWALLTALKNGILDNSLKADPEDVRSIVQDKGYYDSANFASNFKKEQCASLFKGKLERQGAAQALSTAGEDKLAELIRSLIGS